MDGIISFLIISFLFIVIIVSKSNKDDYKNTDSLISSKKSKSEFINNKEKQSNKNQVSIIVTEAQEVLRKQELRKRFIKDFGLYLIQFPQYQKIYYADLKSKFNYVDQPLPDIFELNNFLHELNYEVTFNNNYYMIVPVGTVDFEYKKRHIFSQKN